MIIIKTYASLKKIEVKETILNSVSSSNVQLYIKYSDYPSDRDFLRVRYVGKDSRSSLEVTVSDGLINEIDFMIPPDKIFIDLNSHWVWPENIETTVNSYKVTMSRVYEDNIKSYMREYGFDVHQNFSLFIHSNTIVFLLEKKEVYKARIIGSNLVILLDINDFVVGYSILSEEYALILSEYYSHLRMRPDWITHSKRDYQ